MDAYVDFNFLIPDQQVMEFTQSEESPLSSLYLPSLRSYELGVVRSTESARPLIIGRRQTGRYAVSSFSHLYPAVNQNLLPDLSSDINTSVIFFWHRLSRLHFRE